MCKIVCHSLLNFTHITQHFCWSPIPNSQWSLVERQSEAADLAHPKILAWCPLWYLQPPHCIMIQYLGQCTAATQYPHGNSVTNDRNYVRSWHGHLLFRTCVGQPNTNYRETSTKHPPELMRIQYSIPSWYPGTTSKFRMLPISFRVPSSPSSSASWWHPLLLHGGSTSRHPVLWADTTRQCVPWSVALRSQRVEMRQDPIYAF